MLDRVPWWLGKERKKKKEKKNKRKKTVARVGIPSRCPTTQLTPSNCNDSNSFHFPSCSIITLISSDITYAKPLALRVSSHQLIIPASTSQINADPYE